VRSAPLSSIKNIAALLNESEDLVTTKGTPVKVRHLPIGLPVVSVVPLHKLHTLPIAIIAATRVRGVLFHVGGKIANIKLVAAR